MKNLMKMLLVSLTALSFSVANAGELSITGDAKASYSITSSDGASAKLQQGKGLGVSNVIGFNLFPYPAHNINAVFIFII